MTKRCTTIKGKAMTCPYCSHKHPFLLVRESHQGRERCENCQNEFYCECKLTFTTRALRDYEKEELKGSDDED